MKASFVLTEGNLALAADRACPRISEPVPFDTRIVELPCRREAVSVARNARGSRALDISYTLVSALVILTLIGTLLAMGWLVLASEDAAFSAALSQADRQTIVVRPGDSLWSIAEGHQIEGLSTDQTTEVIRSWNDLASSTLQPGEELVVPAAKG